MRPMLPDINVLVAAYRQDHTHHTAARTWLSDFLDAPGAQPLTLCMPVASGFIRLVTNAKIFPQITPAAQAVDFLDWLGEHSRTRWAQSGDEWPHLRSLVLNQALTGNHIPDAQLAALAQHLGAPLVTFDKGFRKLLPRTLLVVLQPS
jgi:uncharacterized protein